MSYAECKYSNLHKKTYFLCVCTTKLCLKEWIKMTGLKSTRPRALQFIDRSKHSATNEIKITRIVVYVYLVAMLLPSYMYRMFICLFLSPCVSQSVVYIVLYLKKKLSNSSGFQKKNVYRSYTYINVNRNIIVSWLRVPYTLACKTKLIC